MSQVVSIAAARQLQRQRRNTWPQPETGPDAAACIAQAGAAQARMIAALRLTSARDFIPSDTEGAP